MFGAHPLPPRRVIPMLTVIAPLTLRKISVHTLDAQLTTITYTVTSSEYLVLLSERADNRTENVYLFLPNIIGYIRVITAGISLYLLPNRPKLCTTIYFVSCILDVFDGMAARALGQESKFGAVLDMVTDRCATACLLCFLSTTYPNWSLLIMFLITLDFSSHYIHMYS